MLIQAPDELQRFCVQRWEDKLFWGLLAFNLNLAGFGSIEECFSEPYAWVHVHTAILRCTHPFVLCFKEIYSQYALHWGLCGSTCVIAAMWMQYACALGWRCILSSQIIQHMMAWKKLELMSIVSFEYVTMSIMNLVFLK